jgi:hypothetical protein
MLTYLILTVPHAVCDITNSNKNHTCDFLAPKSAHKINELWRQIFPDTKIFLIYGDINRKLVDLNRQQKPMPRFHQKLHNIFTKIQTSHILLWDIHSFPYGSFGKTSSKEEPWLVILYRKKYSWIKLLIDALQKKGYPCKAVLGDRSNYIIQTAHQHYNIPSILLEFNENLSDNQLHLLVFKLINITSELMK